MLLVDVQSIPKLIATCAVQGKRCLECRPAKCGSRAAADCTTLRCLFNVRFIDWFLHTRWPKSYLTETCLYTFFSVNCLFFHRMFILFSNKKLKRIAFRFICFPLLYWNAWTYALNVVFFFLHRLSCYQQVIVEGGRSLKYTVLKCIWTC
jgi:hypothetical protein